MPHFLRDIAALLEAETREQCRTSEKDIAALLVVEDRAAVVVRVPNLSSRRPGRRGAPNKGAKSGCSNPKGRAHMRAEGILSPCHLSF